MMRSAFFKTPRYRSDGLLEAQVHSSPRQQRSGTFFSRLFTHSPSPHVPDDSQDVLQEHPDSTLSEDPSSQDYYHYFANKKTFKKTFGSTKSGKELVESLMRCVTYDQPIDGNALIGPNILSAPEAVTVTEYLDLYLAQELREKSPHYLHICAFLASWTTEAENAFSFFQILLASFGERLHALYNSPKLAIVDSVANIWKLKPEVREVLKGHLSPYPLYPSTQLPSLSSTKIPSNIFSTDGTAITLEWQILPREYKNDLDIYVWQYHLEPPPSISVTVLLIPTSSSQQWRVAILFNPRDVKVTADTPDEEQLLKRFEKEALSWDSRFIAQHEWTACHEILRLILVFYGWMTRDTAKFVDKIAKETRAMTRQGRKRPSRSKIQYLIHLDDCCKKAVEELDRNATLLKSFELTLDDSQFCVDQVEDKDRFLKMIHGKENDIKFLSNRIKRLAKPLDTVRNDIKEQMALASGQRSLILTLLAAIFIPFSLVSGIFGMNLSEPIFPSPIYTTIPTLMADSLGSTIISTTRELVTPVSQISPVITVIGSTLTGESGSEVVVLFTSTSFPPVSVEPPVVLVTILDVTLVSAGSTTVEPITTTTTITPSATVSSTSYPSQHYWNAALYLEIALPLALTTIVLPLVLGSLIRFSMRTAFHHRMKWRLLCAIGVITYLGFSYGFLYWYSNGCGSDCPYLWYYNRSYTAFVVYMVLVPGVLGIIALIGLVQAFKDKSGRASWVFFAVLVVISVVVEVYVDYRAWGSYGANAFDSYSGFVPFRPVPLTSIPWAFLFAKWIFGSSSELPNQMKRRFWGLWGIQNPGRSLSHGQTHRN